MSATHAIATPLVTLTEVRFAYGSGAAAAARARTAPGTRPATHAPASRAGAPASFALDVTRLDVAPKERVAVIGPSGAGKTTLLQLMCGILPLRGAGRAGRVELAGVDLAAIDDARRRALRASHVGLVFQELELLDHLTVLENVLLPYLAVPALHLDRAARARASELLERVGLASHTTRKPRRLSQGERQRVALARALVTEPALVLGDEPTGHLDPDTGERVLELLFDETRRTGAALVMVTHDHSQLARFERIIDVRALSGSDDTLSGDGTFSGDGAPPVDPRAGSGPAQMEPRS
ncbi:MAG: ABC transporter ATP-binding protein [Planctomycetota bacterium]